MEQINRLLMKMSWSHLVNNERRPPKKEEKETKIKKSDLYLPKLTFSVTHKSCHTKI